jgi:hypothetical protein
MATSPPLTWSLGGMMFDAWLSIDSEASAELTSHPVEVGAAANDHVFVQPRRWSFNFGVSDCNVNPVQPGLSSQRSINAWNRIIDALNARNFLRLVTKDGTYDNVVIIDARKQDTVETQFTFKGYVTVQQVIVARTQYYSVTQFPQVTNITNRGQVASQPVRENAVEKAIQGFQGLFR